MIYPKGEQVWASYYNLSHKLLFIITSKSTRDYYFLYELNDDIFKKLGKAKSPLELEEKFKIHQKMKV